MDLIRIIYFCFLLISFILSVFCYKNEKSLYVFPFLIAAALIAEFFSLFFFKLKLDYNIVYHIYLPIEYSLLALYFYLNINKKTIKKIILISIPLFIIISLFFSLEIVSIQKFPNFQTNIEGLLLIIWATINIFSIEIKANLNIAKLPVFWICVAVLVYNCGIFSYIGVYNYICESRPSLTLDLKFYILNLLNYIFYTLISIAFLCSQKMKKYS
jgi:hypothetical protein